MTRSGRPPPSTPDQARRAPRRARCVLCSLLWTTAAALLAEALRELVADDQQARHAAGALVGALDLARRHAQFTRGFPEGADRVVGPERVHPLIGVRAPPVPGACH